MEVPGSVWAHLGLLEASVDLWTPRWPASRTSGDFRKLLETSAVRSDMSDRGRCKILGSTCRRRLGARDESGRFDSAGRARFRRITRILEGQHPTRAVVLL
ncbi:unnamed protein product [Prorocentrum cordatum]|uniref:Uncharacterized protein n=1 Tax=Prorocentrum cordatum TaxID=2364126 RepID=A0ABN9U5L1_9DINO|nr:unnamed protein product [Polarella glacialis]